MVINVTVDEIINRRTDTIGQQRATYKDHPCVYSHSVSMWYCGQVGAYLNVVRADGSVGNDGHELYPVATWKEHEFFLSRGTGVPHLYCRRVDSIEKPRFCASHSYWTNWPDPELGPLCYAAIAAEARRIG